MKSITLYQLIFVLLVVLANSKKPAMKFRGAKASSCVQAQMLAEKYNDCRDEECRNIVKNFIRDAVKESERNKENCDVIVPGEHICARAARYLDGYKASLYANPQDLWFFANKVNGLREKIRRDSIQCDIEIPPIDLCAQAESDLSSIDRECGSNTLCQSYYHKRVEMMLSQLKRNKQACHVTLPREEIPEEVEYEQAEGIETIEPANEQKESSCKRAEDELAVYNTNNCEDLECQLYHIELIKESLKTAEASGEICYVEVPKVNYCAVASSDLNRSYQCGENTLCQNKYISLMQHSLGQAEINGQQCRVKVPVLKQLPVMNSSRGYEYTGASHEYDTISTDCEDSQYKKREVVVDYGYSFSVEL